MEKKIEIGLVELTTKTILGMISFSFVYHASSALRLDFNTNNSNISVFLDSHIYTIIEQFLLFPSSQRSFLSLSPSLHPPL